VESLERKGNKMMNISFKNKLANLVTGEVLAYIATLLFTLLIMPTVLVGTLLVVGQPCLTFGGIAIAAGVAGGLLKNQADSVAMLDCHWEALVQTPDVLIPVMMLLSEYKLRKMDALLPGKDITAERRRWIMTAIDEKLAREQTPKFPVAA
jgi:hypothetical protein